MSERAKRFLDWYYETDDEGLNIGVETKCRCGKKLHHSLKFCYNCGEPVDQRDEKEAQVAHTLRRYDRYLEFALNGSKETRALRLTKMLWGHECDYDYCYENDWLPLWCSHCDERIGHNKSYVFCPGCGRIVNYRSEIKLAWDAWIGAMNRGISYAIGEIEEMPEPMWKDLAPDRYPQWVVRLFRKHNIILKQWNS